MKKIIIILLTTILVSNLFGQTDNYKQLGFDAFEKQDYPLAINYMQKALETNPHDKEIYYYLGYYIHYNAYDSRPLKGYDLNYSDTVFYYFNKALEIDPNYGNAKYFYTAECGANAFYSLQQKDYKNFINHYKMAYEIGGFPDWAIEYGKLILNQVDANGIFFTQGDFVLNICWYLQFCEDYRTDISVIPLALLNRPFFVQEIKNSKLFTPVNIGISDEQILNMHPSKWKEKTIEIPITKELVNEYKLDSNYISWTIAPDLYGAGVFLSCETGFLLDIVESNDWKRPIYWSYGMNDKCLGGLENFGSYKGMVYKLMPFKTSGTINDIDTISLRSFVDEKNFMNYKSILETDQPRVSGLLIYTYSNAFIQLAKYYKENNQTEKVNDLINFYENNLKIGILPDYEEKYLKQIEN